MSESELPEQESPKVELTEEQKRLALVIENKKKLEGDHRIIQYRKLLSKKQPITIAWLDTYDIEYREREYPYNSIYVFPAMGQIQLIDPDTLERIEASQETPDAINPFLESIANGMFAINMSDSFDNAKYQAEAKQNNIKKREEALSDLKAEPHKLPNE